jgi:hypothetical protein
VRALGTAFIRRAHDERAIVCTGHGKHDTNEHEVTGL